MTTRQWLLAHGYIDVVELIDSTISIWKMKGLRTRRNWWQILAGTRKGRPRTIYGVSFPILAVARKHEEFLPIPDAIQRNENEEPPVKLYHGRSLTRYRDRNNLSGSETPRTEQAIPAAETNDRRGNRADFDAVLAKVPDTTPVDGDEL